MAVFQAICTKCGKSINLRKTQTDEYVCPFCGQSFTYAELQAAGDVVDVDKAKADYGRAQHYFSVGDYGMARSLFARVCSTDRNNFFAEFFCRLCDIRSAAAEGKISGADEVVSLVTASVEKMERTSQPDNVKKMFMKHSLSEVAKLLRELTDAIPKIYGDDKMRERRREYLMLAKDVRRLTVPEITSHASDRSVAEELLAIFDIAVHALSLAIAGQATDVSVDLPTAEEYNEARALYGVYLHYMRGADPKYTFPYHDDAVAANIEYNKTVREAVDAYNRLDKTSVKTHLSVKGEPLDDMLRHCRFGFDYTYSTLFRGLGNRGKAAETAGLLGDAMFFAEQLLMPRVFDEADGTRTISTCDFPDMLELAKRLSGVCSELALEDKVGLVNRLDEFYYRVNETIRYHYAIEHPAIRSELTSAREQKNKQYFYSRNFLYGVLCGAAVALTEVMPYDKHHMGDRIKLLKLGKDAAEELLYLFDYKLEEIEKTPKFASLPAIYGYINTDLRAYA